MNMDLMPPKPTPIELFNEFAEIWGPPSENGHIGGDLIRQQLYALVEAFRQAAMQPFIEAAGHAFAMKPQAPIYMGPIPGGEVQIEYRLEYSDKAECYETWINGIGAEGWRLDGIHHDDGCHVFSRVKQAGTHAQQSNPETGATKQ